MFTITRQKEDTGELKSVHADSPSRAYDLYSIAARFDPNPKIYYRNREITFVRLAEMLSADRAKADKELREIEAQHLLQLAKNEQNRQAIEILRRKESQQHKKLQVKNKKLKSQHKVKS